MTTTVPEQTKRRTLRPRTRILVLTTHIIVSVALLGDAAGFLAVAIRKLSSILILVVALGLPSGGNATHSGPESTSTT